jgi:undecaprenyl-diphosphatase
MQNEILLALIQAATEFLPVSSSGHLALFGNMFAKVDLFYFTILHMASVLAILIYTRKEIYQLITFNKKYKRMWIYIIIGILPAGLVGLFFNDFIEQAFSSLLLIGLAYLFTGFMLLITKRFQNTKGKLTKKRSLLIGLAQILALFPGISRSGTTISFGLFSGLKKEEAFKFSFLMAIPLILGATILEFKNAYFNISILVGFVVCLIFSLLFLSLLNQILKKNYFWMFGIYCIILGIITLILAV